MILVKTAQPRGYFKCKETGAEVMKGNTALVAKSRSVSLAIQMGQLVVLEAVEEKEEEEIEKVVESIDSGNAQAKSDEVLIPDNGTEKKIKKTVKKKSDA